MKPSDFFHLEGTGKIPTIYKHTDEQLEVAINAAAREVPNFFVILHGIDAYMERRRRRGRRARLKQAEEARKEWAEIESLEGMWGRD